MGDGIPYDTQSGPDTPPAPPEPGDETELLREPTRATAWCPECETHVVVVDVHAFLLGLHQRVCLELLHVNGDGG